MKLIGALALVLASAGMGLAEALRLRRRARLTADLAAGLELLRGWRRCRRRRSGWRGTDRRRRGAFTRRSARAWRTWAARSSGRSGPRRWSFWTSPTRRARRF